MRGFLPPSWISFFRGGKPWSAALSCSWMWRTSKGWQGGQQGGGLGWRQGGGQGVGQRVGWRLGARRFGDGDGRRGDYIILYCKYIMKLTVVMEMVLDMEVSWEVDKELTKNLYNVLKRFLLKIYWSSTWLLYTGERPSTCELCAKAFSCGNKLKMHMKAPAGDLFNLCLGKSRTVCVSQLCIIRCVFKLLTQEEA